MRIKRACVRRKEKTHRFFYIKVKNRRIYEANLKQQHSFRSRDQGNLSSDPSGTYPSLYTRPKRELISC